MASRVDVKQWDVKYDVVWCADSNAGGMVYRWTESEARKGGPDKGAAAWLAFASYVVTRPSNFVSGTSPYSKMSGLSEDTLHKILQQIQTQAVTSQRALAVVRSQIQSKEKERKILQLTMRELGGVPKGEDRMFRGVGKMFLQQPRESVETEQKQQDKALADELTNLSKKANYLEKQFEEANSQLKDIFHSQQRQAAQ